MAGVLIGLILSYNNHILYIPNIELNNKYDTRITENNLVDYHYNKLKNLRTILAGYGQGFHIYHLLVY